MWRVRSDRQRLDEFSGRVESATLNRMRLTRGEWHNAQKRLSALNPTAVLKRGYAIVTDAEGGVVRSVKQVKKEDVLDIKVADGVILSSVLSESYSPLNGGEPNA